MQRTVIGTAPDRGADVAARFLVRAAITAPSIHNVQPWRFIARPGEIELYLDDARRLPVADPDRREALISCGAALFNIGLAMRHLGFTPEVRLLPDRGRPGLLARVRWGAYARPTAYQETLYRTMTRRRTHRGPFDATPMSPALIDDLRRIARQDGAVLYVESEGPRIRRLAELIGTAEHSQRADPGYVTELARWTPAPDHPRCDGVAPGDYPAQPDGLLFATRDFALGSPWGVRSPAGTWNGQALGVVALLTSRGDRPSDWLATGQALQRVLLHAATHQISAAFHTQPLELPGLRHDIAREFGGGLHPQMIMRLGHTDRRPPARRRPVDDVLFESTPAPVHR